MQKSILIFVKSDVKILNIDIFLGGLKVREDEIRAYFEREILKFENFNTYVEIDLFQKKLYQIAEDNNYTLYKGYDLMLEGYKLYKKGRLENAIKYFLEAFDYNEKDNNYEVNAMIETLIGGAFRELEKNKLSLAYLNAGEKILNKLSVNNQARLLNEIGGSYCILKEYDLALDYYNKSYDLSDKSGNIPLRELVKVNISFILSQKGDTDMEINKIKEVINYFKEKGLSRVVASMYDVLADIESIRGREDIAIQYYEKSAWIFYKEKAIAYYLKSKRNALELKAKKDFYSSNFELEILEGINLANDYELDSYLISFRKMYIDFLLTKGLTDKLNEQWKVLRVEEERFREKEKKQEENLMLIFMNKLKRAL